MIPSMLARICRFLVGCVLLPICVVVTLAVIGIVRSLHPAGGLLAFPFLALAGGFLLWLLLFFWLPRPVRTYILAHELTHALWGALMGAQVLDMRISKQKGSVTLSKNNFLITLAPYFFPLYAVLTIVTYFVLSLFWNMERYYLIWLALVGGTWGFHFTFTVLTLLQRQSDIEEYGWLFSYTTIYVFNVIGIGLWVVMVSSATIEHWVDLIRSESLLVFSFLETGLGYIFEKVLK